MGTLNPHLFVIQPVAIVLQAFYSSNMSSVTTQQLFGENSVLHDGSLYLRATDLKGVKETSLGCFDPEKGDAVRVIYYLVNTLSQKAQELSAQGTAPTNCTITATGIRTQGDTASKRFNQVFILSLFPPDGTQDPPLRTQDDGGSFIYSDVGRTIVFKRPERSAILNVEKDESADIWAIHEGSKSATTSKGIIPWNELGYLWDFIENIESL